MRKLELVGKEFGRLIVISEKVDGKNGRVAWNCKCICGKHTIVNGSHLMNGHTRSCGCMFIEKQQLGTIKYSIRFDFKKMPEYSVWLNMKQRCYNPYNKEYKYYGGRGIKVCDRWLNSFELFFEDVGKRPSSKHSLDRFPNKNGDYEPQNVRWATQKQQMGNTRKNVWIEYSGQKMILQDWADYLDINSSNLGNYLKHHSFKEAYHHYKEFRLLKPHI